jgi:hypothetical protein
MSAADPGLTDDASPDDAGNEPGPCGASGNAMGSSGDFTKN